MMKLLAGLFAVCACVYGTDIYINQYQGADGRMYYMAPLYCNYSGSLLTSTYYDKVRATYTARNDRNCCYLADSRNQCCLQADGATVQQCRCSPTITCGLQPKVDTTTAAPTTTTTPTTIVRASLCPSAYRILNGIPVNNDCAFEGIAKITTNNGTVVTCNAVLVVATVNGTLKKTFVTTTICTLLIATGTFDISIGNQNFPIIASRFSVTNGTNGISYITITDSYISLLCDLSPCHRAACGYNPATMCGKVDFDDCKVASWGSSHADRLVSTGLYETAIKISPSGCTSIPNLYGLTTSLCFSTVSGKNLNCSRDHGAPVYCKAPSNGEWILMGSVAMQLVCNGSSEIKVIPFPG